MHLIGLVFGIALMSLNLAGTARSEPPAREPLDALWERHMYEGTFVFKTLKDSQIKVVEIHPKSADPEERHRIYGPNMSHPISIMKLGDGLFGNGGWILGGGLLSRIRTGWYKIELYVKEVVRQFPYFPFPPHRDPPQEIGYEFYLLVRTNGSTSPTIMGKWTFTADEVVQKNPEYPSVRASLNFNAETKTANVIINGLKRPFEESVNLSSGLSNN